MTRIPMDSLDISQELKRSAREMGFEYATEIQAQTIPLILEGHDIVGRSQTGTGKTAAFGIPAVEMIDGENKTDVQVLVLCPTRELAIQSWGEFKKIYKYKSGVKAAVIYGGQPIDRQIKELKKGINVVIGTPGRIMDHLRRRTLKLKNLRLIVLDEADEMLDMGFREDIETILKATPEARQTILFCATMPPEIMAITKTYQKQPELVEVNREEATLGAIEQYYCESPADKKPAALISLLDLKKPRLSIVFCNTQKMVDELCRFLGQNGHEALGLHGRMRQDVRTRVMESFKNGRTAILVATDVAARGIDAQDVEAVINYDIPQSTEYYIHRIGRTGRAGKAGCAYTIVGSNVQMQQMREIERAVKTEIIFQNIKLEGQTPHFSGVQLKNESVQYKNTTKAPHEAALRQNKVNIAANGDKPKPNGGAVKILLNLGKEQHIAPNNIVGAITEKTSLSGGDIGKIEILSRSAVVEIPGPNAKEVIDAMNGSKIKGRPVNARLHGGQDD